MKPSNKCKLYMQIILDMHSAELDKFSPGASEAIAFMLAGSICYAEKFSNVETAHEEIRTLISELVRRITSTSTKFHLKGNVNIQVFIVAYQRYRKKALNSLGGETSDPTHRE